MKISRFTYKGPDWELLDLELGTVNLIVGKNATGKSRTLQCIDAVYNIILQKERRSTEGTWRIDFTRRDGDLISYEFIITNLLDSKVLSDLAVELEKITINDEIVLLREHGKAEIKNLSTREMEKSNPPGDKLVIHSNRDLVKYPFFEDIIKWAEQSYGFKFGSFRPGSRLPGYNNAYNFLNKIDDAAALFELLNEEERLNVQKNINAIGYKIDGIKLLEHGGLNLLLFTEEAVEKVLALQNLSQGMLRSIAMLISIEYLISKEAPATIVIDDLGEGLDYERTTKLGKLLFDVCEKNDIQLIVTSNDMFLMDVIDIEYWNVLQRNGQRVKALNKKNSPELFSDFQFTGLSNFDFFSSDYITKKLGTDKW